MKKPRPKSRSTKIKRGGKRAAAPTVDLAAALPRPSKKTVADPGRDPRVYRALLKLYPDATCALHHGSAFELLVATILSAQCTDERVNKVTPGLFKKYPTVESFAAADTAELEQAVRSTGFYRNKARSIQGAARLLVQKFGGQVPDNMDDLLELPGVARKTANVVLGNAFSKSIGVVVDTHVTRLGHRLAFTDHHDPVKIERDLMELFPAKDWTMLSHLLIFHGRRICIARRPRCFECPLSPDCPKRGVTNPAPLPTDKPAPGSAKP